MHTCMHNSLACDVQPPIFDIKVAQGLIFTKPYNNDPILQEYMFKFSLLSHLLQQRPSLCVHVQRWRSQCKCWGEPPQIKRSRTLKFQVAENFPQNHQHHAPYNINYALGQIRIIVLHNYIFFLLRSEISNYC